MALDWTGIIVERDFYSEHYLSSVLEEDLRPVFGRWTAAEQDSPIQAVTVASKEWAAAREQLDDLTDIENRRTCQREWLVPLLTALGYPWQPDERPSEDGTSIPVVGEVARANGQPELWLLEALELTNELADPLLLPVTPGDASEDAVTWEDFITDQVFSGAEPPRWVLLFHLGQLVLIERGKWAERRLLRFDFEKLLTSSDARKLFAVLVARESICPSDGNNLLDRLAESSHSHLGEQDGEQYRPRLPSAGKTPCTLWLAAHCSAVGGAGADALQRPSVRGVWRYRDPGVCSRS